VFKSQFISAAVKSAAEWRKAGNKSDDWWNAQADGTIVHYSNTRSQWIRGVVKDHKMIPTALLGTWSPWDLPRLLIDGTIQQGHHAQRIADGEAMQPHASNMYEYAPDKYNPNIPTPPEMDEIDLTVAPPTPEQQELMTKWAKAQVAIEALNETCNEYAHTFDQSRKGNA
jgi:hypothetical protein